MSFTQKILLAMVGGIAAGLVLGAYEGVPLVDDLIVGGLLTIVGRIFVALLQMMVVPLVLVSLVCGVTSLGDPAALGRLGLKTLVLYLLTTAFALTLVLTLAVLVSPGEGFPLLMDDVSFDVQEAPSVVDVIVNMVPSNPIRALADGQMLQIIVFALLLGFAISVSGEAGRRVSGLFNDLNEVVTRLVMLVIKTAPIGVFALVGRTFATEGLELFVPLASYASVVVVGLVFQVLVVYAMVLRVAGLNPVTFLMKSRALMAFAFGTSSSSATIPVTLDTVERRHGVSNSVASFTVPLGATINMDGTAIMQGAATVFIANVYGIDLGLGHYVTVILMATLASIGTAAVPSAGLVMLAMVLQQIGLPVEGIALIIGIDRLLDMMRTAVNVTGDCAVTCVVARTEKAIDMSVYADREAGAGPGSAPAAPARTGME